MPTRHRTAWRRPVRLRRSSSSTPRPVQARLKATSVYNGSIGSTSMTAHPPPDAAGGPPTMLGERPPQTLTRRPNERINPDAIVANDLNSPGPNLRQMQRRAKDHRAHHNPSTPSDFAGL
jgi:hypothetical protein